MIIKALFVLVRFLCNPSRLVGCVVEAVLLYFRETWLKACLIASKISEVSPRASSSCPRLPFEADFYASLLFFIFFNVIIFGLDFAVLLNIAFSSVLCIKLTSDTD